MTQYVHAVRDIYPGEEILVTYLTIENTYEERRQAALASWGFDCKCSLCRKPLAQRETSDRRLLMIAELKDKLKDWSDTTFDRTKAAELMISLFEQEGMHGSIGEAYEAAAYAYSVLGDEQNAIKWASKAVDIFSILYGQESDSVKNVLTLMMDPKKHRTWRFRATGPDPDKKPKKDPNAKSWGAF